MEQPQPVSLALAIISNRLIHQFIGPTVAPA